tara:strand:+ start:6370 stop:6660 length:291 start_codon:yes stop_codon:yes gene_type:complete
MSDNLDSAVAGVVEAIQQCTEVEDAQFPSMIKFGTTTLGFKMYASLNKLRKCIKAEMETSVIDERERHAEDKGEEWLRKLSSKVKSNISAQMKGSI